MDSRVWAGLTLLSNDGGQVQDEGSRDGKKGADLRVGSEGELPEGLRG